MLEVKNLNAHYGAIHALKGISFTVNKGEIVTLIGSNGAGKSTTLNSISGLIKNRKGSIKFEDEEIIKCRTDEIVKRGIVQVPEGRRIFAELTVEENLKMGAYLRNDSDGVKKDMKKVFDMFPRLAERKTQLGGTLSGGEQQMLAIARALLSKPKLLMLDEPSMGLAPIIVEQIFAFIKEMNEKDGLTILLVEQNANMALSIAHRGYVLETGNIVLSDTAEKLRTDDEVRKAYLGEG
ncbi:ABC transporter ATP-binding protein [Thermosyntropha sp.]|uniref:ABC transporter ATP-binding protein n=1 Tax=Thermosyntropha sp. TaxID=2740820 RepID=UPI0025FB658D|nr:ABC transporter ATP-binding protein [Thermosyntropha sp.]MBO8159295.1 ABC transporter ATP-binding protein [Thermosyntropha sp.]